ncbi:MAG: 4-hydroxybenzoate octaprenyltransferase [Bacteroidetes bacterium ADurb.Bin397]|jgi:4-hydroxybenzoate polyprenyltransferase|nr:MAG: 4-hydroxybenzoate octaprenyltransferase [Bacteroidetes bacterium ADurb.Bin397]
MKKSGISSYLSLIKFSHTVFALPFALIGFLTGAREVNFNFNPWLILTVLLCMVFARSAAMAFNRWADRDIDAKNERTAIREIPAGIISPNAAILFTLLNAVAFIVTTWFINPICFYLSPVALLVVLGYSYTKRFTPFSHIVLGIGLSLAPIGAYLAVTGEFALVPVLFSVAVVTWVSGFDIIYALQDEVFDKQQKLFSIPSVFGSKISLRISEVLHITAAGVLLAASFYGHLGWIYLAGWAIFTGLLIYQHTLVKIGDLSKVNIAFFTTNGIASVVLAVFATIEILIG